MMEEIILYNSVITGIHSTKFGSHPKIVLDVLKDDTRLQDKQCMKIVCPLDVPEEYHRLICWPRNPSRDRWFNQLITDTLGQKIGHVPANVCGLFRELLDDGVVKSIRCQPTRNHPRARFFETRKFRKVLNGRDQAGGGVVLDCRYVLTVEKIKVQHTIRLISDFLHQHDGPETLDKKEAIQIYIDEPEPVPKLHTFPNFQELFDSW